MKNIFKTGRWFITIFVLLILTGYMPAGRRGRQEDVQIDTLVRLARANLQARLGIQAEAIDLESIRPLIFFCPAPDTCQERQPGYVMRLAADHIVYEYNARMVGKQCILWYEVEVGQPWTGEE